MSSLWCDLSPDMVMPMSLAVDPVERVARQSHVASVPVSDEKKCVSDVGHPHPQNHSSSLRNFPKILSYSHLLWVSSLCLIKPGKGISNQQQYFW